MASSSSTTALKASKGWAPTSFRPLMKKDGVPVAPTAEASAWSRRMRGSAALLASAAFRRAASSPAAAAGLLERRVVEGRGRLEEGVVHGPEAGVALLASRTASAASAAGRARGWNGSGLCLKAKRSWPGIGLLELLERRPDPLAEGALEVRDLDDGDQRVGRPLERGVGHRHLVDGLGVLLRAGRRGRRRAAAAGGVGWARDEGPVTRALRVKKPMATPTTSARNQLTCFMG